MLIEFATFSLSLIYLVLWVAAAVTLDCIHVISFTGVGAVLFVLLPIGAGYNWRIEYGSAMCEHGEIYIFLSLLPPTSLLLYQSVVHQWKSCMNFELLYLAEMIITLLFVQCKKRDVYQRSLREHNVYYRESFV